MKDYSHVYKYIEIEDWPHTIGIIKELLDDIKEKDTIIKNNTDIQQIINYYEQEIKEKDAEIEKLTNAVQWHRDKYRAEHPSKDWD